MCQKKVHKKIIFNRQGVKFFGIENKKNPKKSCEKGEKSALIVTIFQKYSYKAIKCK